MGTKKEALMPREEISTLIRMCVSFFITIGNFFRSIWPFLALLIAAALPKFVWDIRFEDYLKFLELLVWPGTVLIILYFFRTVMTYLFFSWNEFNFFGVKGNLKKVDDVIKEEVNKKFLKQKKIKRQKKKMNQLKLELMSKSGTAEEMSNIAKKILKEWDESNKIKDAEIADLKQENRKMREMVSCIPTDSVSVEASNTQLGSSETAGLESLVEPLKT